MLISLIVVVSGCSSATPAPVAWRYPAAPRMIAVGDLHGDLAIARDVLRQVGAIDEHDRWIGGSLVVVQTGDQIDRGPDDPDVIDFFEKLAPRAAAAGGAVHSLLGNHEVWNVQGYFYSVTAEGYSDFAGQDISALAPELRRRNARKAWGRLAAFTPGGPYARKLADRLVILQVGETVFAHGGVTLRHVDYGIDKLNREAGQWLAGQTDAQPEELQKRHSPTWVRRLSEGEPSPADCAELGTVLKRLEAARLVMGHTIQEGGITSACDGKAWRIDVGLSAFYGGPVQVLEIVGDAVRPLTAKRTGPRPDGQSSSPH